MPWLADRPSTTTLRQPALQALAVLYLDDGPTLTT
jgi:hypothetical protein